MKLALSREGVFRVVGGRTIAEQRVALGARERRTTDRADSHRHDGDHHARAVTPSNVRFPPRHLYASRNIYVDQKIVNLDTVANTWMRAPGESIGTFALESAMDELAYAAGHGSDGTAPHQRTREGPDEAQRISRAAI